MRSVGLLVVALVVFGVAYPAHPQTYVDITGELLSDTEKSALSVRLRSELTDPISAQIAALSKCTDGVYLGVINAKNTLGAYTGFTTFCCRTKSSAILSI